MQTDIMAQTVMTKPEAQGKHAQILKLTSDYVDVVGPIALEMRNREGWRVLGFKSWTDYCKHIDKRISAVNVMRLAQKAEIEQNVEAHLPMRHALALARLPSPEAQCDVFKAVASHCENPVEQNYHTYVDAWFRKHEPDSRRDRNRGHEDGWTKGDLDTDSDLSDALNHIEEVYGPSDRTAIQNRAIGLSRKDIIALSAFHVSKMKQVRYLIMGNHWDVATAIRFVENKPHDETTIGSLKNYCISTAELHYTCSVGGFDISIKACPAVARKIREPMRENSVKPRVTWITRW
jgi:hypothetical protein